MRLKPALSFVLIATLGLSLTGCAQVMKAITPAPKVNHVTIAAKVAAPGASITGKLAKDAPANLPLWPGSAVMRSRVTKGSTGNSWSAMLVTSDSYAEIVSGTAKGFQDAGWQVAEQDVSSADASSTVLTVMSSGGEGVVTIAPWREKMTQIDYVITTSK